MKVWALMEFIDVDGTKHEVDGKPFDLPRNTDSEKHTFARLEEIGIITTKPSEAKAEQEPQDEDENGRTGRKRS
jgi:hypothetical protein